MLLEVDLTFYLHFILDNRGKTKGTKVNKSVVKI